MLNATITIQFVRNLQCLDGIGYDNAILHLYITHFERDKIPFTAVACHNDKPNLTVVVVSCKIY